LAPHLRRPLAAIPARLSASVIQTVGEGCWNGLEATISDPRG